MTVEICYGNDYGSIEWEHPSLPRKGEYLHLGDFVEDTLIKGEGYISNLSWKVEYVSWRKTGGSISVFLSLVHENEKIYDEL